MGTMLALLLVLGTLSGCAVGTMANLQSALPPPAEEAIVLRVETEASTGTIPGDGGTALVEYSYELPVMYASLEDGTPLTDPRTPDQERALAMAETFNATFASWRTAAQELAETAREDNAFRTEEGLPLETYMDDLTCEVYQTGQLVSVSGVYFTYAGGAHGNSILMSWNFDLTTGEFFEPDFLGGNGGDDILKELERQAEEMGAADSYWENYRDILADWRNASISFDEEGVSIGFSPYELGPYAIGPQVFHLTYAQLRPSFSQHDQSLLGL